MKPSLHFTLVFLLVFQGTWAWDSDEYEIFDLVEELNEGVNQNFYEYMELTSEATTSEIRKAYRKLSLVLHPDKNSAEDAALKFRWLASIYEVLKDPEKRKIYDRVLVEGLPDWRSPVFYFRRIRKIGLAECLCWLSVIVSVFQYFINKAHYWEKKFTLQENVKANKKLKNQNVDEQIAEFLGPPPTIYDTLPFQTYRGIKYLIFTIPTMPGTILSAYEEMKEKKAEEERLLREEEELAKQREIEKLEKKQRKRERKRIVYDEKEKGDGETDTSENGIQNDAKEDVFKLPANANQIWTDVDLTKLAKLIKKYPAGTPERWEKIADILERLPNEVTKMAKKIKDNAYIIPTAKTQGITGLETTKYVNDNVMENTTETLSDEDENSDEDSEDTSEESDEDSDGGLRAYTVASNDFVPSFEVKTKVKTKGGKTQPQEDEVNATSTPNEAVKEPSEEVNDSPEQNWSQSQQKALEAALVQFPKGTTERWERIANKVPGKTKDQCILRFKHLAEMIKKKKEASANEQ